MKTASAGLIALLNSGVPIFMADHYTITLNDSTVLRWTTWDADLVLNTFTFSSQGPMLERGKTRCVAGLEVDTLDVTIMTGDTTQLNGVPMPLAAHNGAFDGARIMLERSFMSVAGTITGSLVMFEGQVAGVDPSSTQVILHVKSELDKLNLAQPHNIFSPQCQNCLYDAACTMNRATFTVSSAAASGSSVSTVKSALAQASGYFTLGVIVFTSGANSGTRRAVKSFASGDIGLTIPLSSVPAIGDTFTIYPGCDHTNATCASKFSNTNFRGYPNVPRAETAR